MYDPATRRAFNEKLRRMGIFPEGPHPWLPEPDAGAEGE
jgi:hypothetical protein